MSKQTPYRILLIPRTPEMIAICEEAKLEFNVVNEKKIFASYITPFEYSKQLSDPDSKWMCPITNIEGLFDDEYYEDYFANK
jgi:hypothetical protein